MIENIYAAIGTFFAVVVVIAPICVTAEAMILFWKYYHR